MPQPRGGSRQAAEWHHRHAFARGGSVLDGEVRPFEPGDSSDPIAAPAEIEAAGSSRWSRSQLIALAGGLALAVAIRALLLPTEGYRFDLDTFARWAHEVTVGGIAHAYDGDINLGPVMVYVWAVLGAIEPAFRTAVDASDPVVRAFLKAPASLADLALAIGAAWLLRDRPWWAVAGALAIGLHPAVIDESAWWGQYESLYVLPAFVAFLFAVAGKPIPSAIALAICAMTKPQALPLVVPFVGFALGRLGPRQVTAAVVAFLVTAVILWLPFIPANGPANYLHILAGAQNGAFASLSVGAWNLWWLVGQALPPVSDATPIFGPLSARAIGLALAGLAELAVIVAVWRVPTPRRLALGLACSTLVTFSLLTTMHERYSFAALIFLVPLLWDRRVLATWLAASIGITANFVLMIQPWSPGERTMLWLVLEGSVIGAALILLATWSSLWLLIHRERPASDPVREVPG